jgi:hypothetical protein
VSYFSDFSAFVFYDLNAATFQPNRRVAMTIHSMILLSISFNNIVYIVPDPVHFKVAQFPDI